MNPIKLINFADHSQKVPAEFLTPRSLLKTSSTWKILTSHFMDFTAAFFASTFMTIIFGMSFEALMLTDGLRATLARKAPMPMEAMILPIVLLSYFFISYFLNHGQSFGMLQLKSRISMKSQSFREAFLWSIHSSLLCFSLGLSYLVFKKKWESFKVHDYLYEQLMDEKEISPINLISKIEELQSLTNDEIQEEWIEAA